MIIAMRTMITKRGDRMAFLTVEDRTGRQEVAVFADLFAEQRELLKKDNIVVIVGDAKPDDYTGGVRVRAIAIMDLPTARNTYAKKLLLNVDASQGLDEDFVPKLQSVLQPYSPGTCEIEVMYKNADSQAMIRFGDQWLVNPEEQLLESIEQLAGGKVSAEVCY